MIFTKSVLVVIIHDAIESYKVSVSKVNGHRQRQINTLYQVCERATLDTVIVSTVVRLADEMDAPLSWFRWIYQPPSRFAGILRDVIKRYQQGISQVVGQCPKSLQPVSAEKVEPSICEFPSHDELLNEARQLHDGVFALTAPQSYSTVPRGNYL